jgi:hypothetical protein
MFMRFRETLRAAMTAALVCLSLAGCGQERRPTAADFDHVTQRLDDELNAPVKSLRDNLVRSLADQKIFDPEMVVTGEGNPTPVDWFVYDKGLVRFGGVSEYYGFFVLTQKGQAFAAQKRPQWLMGVIEGQPQVTCAGGGSWESCKVVATAQVKRTPEGVGFVGTDRFPQVSYQADLVYGPSGRRVDQFETTDPEDVSEASRRWIFGDDASAGKAHYRFGLKVYRMVG